MPMQIKFRTKICTDNANLCQFRQT